MNMPWNSTTNDNKRHKRDTSRIDVTNPAFNNSFSPSDEQLRGFDANFNKWVDFVSFCRFYPDLFFDLITPETGGIRLDLDQRVFLRCLSRFISTYAVFPRGYGKCQASDTLVFTEDGIKELGSFFNYDSSSKEKYVVSEINLVNRYGKLEKTNAGVYSGFLPTKKIRTEEGYGVECTHNHPMLILRNGKLDWVLSKDIQVGDYMPVSRGQNVWGNKTKLDFDVESHFKTSDLSKISTDRIIKNKCNTPNELTEEIALIIGYLIGDGTLTRANNISLTNIDKDIIDNYTSFMENIIGLKVSHKVDNIQHEVYSIYAREYFRQIGLKQADALNKEVPHCIMSAPKNIVAAFIRGLFDTDGGLSNAYIEYATSSEKMSKQIQVILSNFGIISTRKVKQTKRNPSYRICIFSKNMDIYLREIGFSCKRKQDRLIELCNKKRNVNKDVIPFQKDLITKFYNSYKQFGWRLSKDKYFYLNDVLCHVLTGANELTYEKLEYILSLPYASKCDGYEELLELKNLNYFYSKVSTIEDGENHVYDLSVPESHSFVSNGLISHNTFIEVLSMYHTAIFFPGIEISMTAQTKQNASDILESKHKEILKYYPLLEAEIEGKPQFSKDSAVVNFRSKSTIDVLANQQSSKGQRRRRINIEESALLNDELFQDVLLPIINVPRRTVGKLSCIVPEELNGQANFLTTSGFRGSSEYARSLQMIDEMAELKGKMVIGADWKLACEFGRGQPRNEILAMKDDPNTSPTAFSMNYESRWVGASDGALVNINKVMDLRTLAKAEIEGDGKSEYIIGMDVARSDSNQNNQSSIAVVKVKRNKDGKIIRASLVNLINLKNGLNFTAQAAVLKRTKIRYGAKLVCVDSNGLGVGLLDECLKDTIDPLTGESLGCWDTVNTDAQPETDDAEECLFDLKSQGINSDIIVNFIDYVESKKLQLLEKKIDNNTMAYTEDQIESEVNPFVQTNSLIEEIANLKLKQLSGGKYTVERLTKRVDKDRYSSLAYALWMVKTQLDDSINVTENSATDYLLIN
jgi:ribonucleoside-diphosphate reductase alpha chain